MHLPRSLLFLTFSLISLQIVHCASTGGKDPDDPDPDESNPSSRTGNEETVDGAIPEDYYLVSIVARDAIPSNVLFQSRGDAYAIAGTLPHMSCIFLQRDS